MASDAQHGRRASEGEGAGGGYRKNWGEDSREERHPDGEPAAPGSPTTAREERDRIDEESEESFPASDPPSFTPEKIG